MTVSLSVGSLYLAGKVTGVLRKDLPFHLSLYVLGSYHSNLFLGPIVFNSSSP